MTPVLDKLISEGYIDRIKDESDRRISIIKTTEKGKWLLELHMQWVNQNLGKSLEKLSEDEIEELWYLLKRLKKLVVKMISTGQQKGDEEINV